MKQFFSFSKFKTKKEISSSNRLFISSALILLSLFLLISFISYFFTGEIDQSNLNEFGKTKANANSLGKIGAIVSDFFIYKGFGVSSVIFSFLIVITALNISFGFNKGKILKNWIWGFYLIFLFSVIFGTIDNGNIYSGIIGFEVVTFLNIYISEIGIILLIIFMSIMYLTLRLKIGVNDILNMVNL